MTPAHAAVTSAAQPAATTPPYTCETGSSNGQEYVGWCAGSDGTVAYRTVALCADGWVAAGIERPVGNPLGSTANCGSDSGLSTSDDWGYLLCSNDTGLGTGTAYVDKSGDISGILQTMGNGTISTGATDLCDWDIAGGTLADAAFT